MLQRGDSGDGCDLTSTLCKSEFGRGNLFVLCWPGVRRVRRASISSELIMCSRGVHCILLLHLPRDNICMYMAHVYLFISVVVTVWENCLLCSGRFLKIVSV